MTKPAPEIPRLPTEAPSKFNFTNGACGGRQQTSFLLTLDLTE